MRPGTNRSRSGNRVSGKRRRSRTGKAVAHRAAALAPSPPLSRGGATQPFNRVVWPWEGVAGTALLYPWESLRIPGVARASQIYSGMLKQAPMESFRGIDPVQPRPRLLEEPDPNESRPWFVQCHVEDYLWSGNAVNYITSYGSDGWPATVVWLPAAWVQITTPPQRYDDPTYYVNGVQIETSRVVHIKRGADRWNPARGVGVIEQHLATLDRAALEEDYERDALRNGAVPSVAVITPNPRLGTDEANEAKVAWLDKFGPAKREPAILPAGTQVIPLAWSPEDAQLTQARQMTLVDVANCFNLDPYWLGAPGSSLTYRSPGPMYTNLLRVSLEPVLADFESIWSMKWLPRGQKVRFDRLALTRDDLQTMVATLTMAISGNPPLMTQAEARVMLGLPPTAPGLTTAPPTSEPAPPANVEE
jgi:HK97 family phage portal protein